LIQKSGHKKKRKSHPGKGKQTIAKRRRSKKRKHFDSGRTMTRPESVTGDTGNFVKKWGRTGRPREGRRKG